MDVHYLAKEVSLLLTLGSTDTSFTSDMCKIVETLLKNSSSHSLRVEIMVLDLSSDY